MPSIRTREEFQSAISPAILDNVHLHFLYKIKGILRQAQCSFGDGQIQPSNKKGSYCQLARTQFKNISQRKVPEVNNIGRVFPEKTTEGAKIPDDCWDCVSIAYAMPALNNVLNEYSAT